MTFDSQLKRPGMLSRLIYTKIGPNSASDTFQKKFKGFEMPAKKKPKRDACYHKVKRAMPKTSAYRSGHMVRCRKVGAKTTTLAVVKVAKGKKRSGSSDGLKKWFSRNKGKGWVNCKTGGPCGRKSKKSGGSYPACRPTMAQCKTAKGKAATHKKTPSKRVNWKG